MKRTNGFIAALFAKPYAGFIVVCILILSGSYGCTANDSCLYYEPAYVNKVDVFRTGSVNQDIKFYIYFNCYNGCGQFGNFDISTSGNTRTILVNAKYEGCICTLNVPVLLTSYTFRSSQPGTFYFRFQTDQNSWLTDTLTIQ